MGQSPPTAAPDLGYPLLPLAPDAYAFESERGNRYTIRFLRYWQEDVVSLYLGVELAIYEIYFEITEIKQRAHDRRIQLTVMKAITDFLEVDNRVGFFDIYREDGRGLQNLRVYRMWLRRSEYHRKQKSVMINRIVRIPDQTDNHIACVIMGNNQLFVDQDKGRMMDEVLKEIFPRAELIPF